MVEPANERGWGNPDAPNFRRDNIVRLEVAGVTLPVHRAVAPLFKAFITELCSSRYGNYRLNNVTDDWGYANRDVRGRPGVKSNHSWGLAVDLNATTNPMTDDGRCHTDLPSGISALAAKYGLRWGGDYSGRKDPMHFEFTGTPAEAQARVSRLKSMPRKTRLETNPYREPRVSNDHVAQRGASGDGVKWIQHQLSRLPKDGEYGEDLVRAVNAFQKSRGLKADGEVGPVTLEALRTL